MRDFLKKELIIDAVIILVIVIFLEFFSLTLLPVNSVLKFPAVFGIGILLIVVAFIGFTQKGIGKHPLDKLVFLFVCSMILSSFMANIYWEQSFLSSLTAYRHFYIYFLYFIFIHFKLPLRRIERIAVLLFFLSLLVFLIDFITFPNPLFAWRNEERRNGITVFFYGQGFTFLGAFYFLNKFFGDKKVTHLLLFAVSFLCLFLLTQSRINLIALISGFFILLIFSDFKKKYIVTLLLVIGGFYFYANSSIFSGIKEDTKDQAAFYKEDVRFLAHRYFLTQLQGGVPTMLFGNGVPGKNSSLELEADKGGLVGFYTSDVGLTGMYSYFGMLGAVIWLFFFYSVFKVRGLENMTYLKVYFWTLLASAFVGYSIFDPGYMPATVLVLYLVRCQSSLTNNKRNWKKANRG